MRLRAFFHSRRMYHLSPRKVISLLISVSILVYGTVNAVSVYPREAVDHACLTMLWLAAVKFRLCQFSNLFKNFSYGLGAWHIHVY